MGEIGTENEGNGRRNWGTSLGGRLVGDGERTVVGFWLEMDGSRLVRGGRRWRAQSGKKMGRWRERENFGGSSVWDENEKMGIDGWVLKFEFFFYI
jgi:hypothetical protein